MHNSSSGSGPDITGLSAADLAELDQLFATEGVAQEQGRTITPRDRNASTPASFSQELLWMLDRATPGLTAYNLPLARRLRGNLDVAALERALTAIAARHEALRTRFADGEGHPIQLVDAAAPVALHRVDLSNLSALERESAAVREVTQRARTPIDLAHEHSFRITLLKLADDDHVLLVETHHIIADGWSMGIVFRELATAYSAARAGREPNFAPLAIQFGDIAAWERDRLAGARLEELLTFWREQIGTAASEPLALPTDFSRSSTPTFAGGRHTVVLTPAQLTAVKSLGQANGATLYMTLLAAYATVLQRYTGRTNVLVGSGSAGRSIPETESVVGYVNSTLVQRADFSGNPTFAQLLQRVKTSAVNAYDHQDIPLEKLVLELREGQERLSDAPLFEVVLTMQDTIGGTLSLEDVTMEPFGIDFRATKFDVTLLVTERDEQLALTAQYRSDLFRPDTMQRLLGHIVQVLESAIANPAQPVSSITLLTRAESEQLQAWNNTTSDEGSAATLTQLFEQQVARVPNNIAIVAGSTSLTYNQINSHANQLAHHLQRAGVTSNTPVGVLLDRSADALIAILGTLKARGAYVPLSVDAPATRIAQQIAECGAQIVVTASSYASKLPAGVTATVLDDATQLASLKAQPTQNLAGGAPSDLAYVLFTSGSTGTPKGVAVTHANVVHYARAVSRVLAGAASTNSGDAFAAMDGWHFAMASTLAADLGNTSLFPSLLSGGTLHVLPQDVTTDPALFAEYAAQHKIDVLKITPNHLMALAAGKTGSELANVLPTRCVVLGGEALRPDVARRLLGANSCRVLNHYGPTETTVGVCTFEVTREALDAVEAFGATTVPVGMPLANTRAYVVDANGQQQPIGIPGELWLGGLGVTNGYFNRPALTDERFVQYQNGHSSERVYKTGDSVRRLPNGAIEFLGRIDDQVKVRGYRVELGEIEHVVRAQPGVETSVVVLRAAADEADPTLVAYVVLKHAGYEVSHSARPSRESISAALAEQLPAYMVPDAVVILDALPLTANGKIDRAKLPAPDASATVSEYVAPRTETEKKIATMWMEVFKKENIGLTDNFLLLGGHSLLAIRVLGKISKAFGVRLALRALFDAPTVEQLAELVDIEVQMAAIDALSKK